MQQEIKLVEKFDEDRDKPFCLFMPLAFVVTLWAFACAVAQWRVADKPEKGRHWPLLNNPDPRLRRVYAVLYVVIGLVAALVGFGVLAN